jgi:hypothetical protein
VGDDLRDWMDPVMRSSRLEDTEVVP